MTIKLNSHCLILSSLSLFFYCSQISYIDKFVPKDFSIYRYFKCYCTQGFCLDRIDFDICYAKNLKTIYEIRECNTEKLNVPLHVGLSRYVKLIYRKW